MRGFKNRAPSRVYGIYGDVGQALVAQRAGTSKQDACTGAPQQQP